MMSAYDAARAALMRAIHEAAPHLNEAADLSGTRIATDDGRNQWAACHLMILTAIEILHDALDANKQAPGS